MNARLRAWTIPSSVLALTAILSCVPVAVVFYASVRTGAPGSPGAELTLAHWQALLQPRSLTAIRNTLLIALYTTIGALLIGVVLAWLVARTDLPRRNLVGSLVLAPLMTSPLLTTMAWILLANPRVGLLNHWLDRVPLIGDLTLDILTRGGIVFVMILNFVPFVYLASLSSLDGMDAALENAARVAGAPGHKIARTITLPLVRPAILSSALLVFVLASGQFSVATLIGLQAGIPTLQYDLYSSMVDSPTRPNFAAAVGTFLVLVSVLGLVLSGFLTRRSEKYITITGKGGSDRTVVRLGKLRWPAVGLCVLYIAFAVILPYLTLLVASFSKYLTPHLTWSLFGLNNYQYIAERSNLIAAFQNTALYAVVGATATVALAAYITYLVVRRRSIITRAVAMFANLPLAIPQLSLGLGILWFYISVPFQIYGTAVILIIAYVAAFLPHALRLLTGSMLQIDPDLEDAAVVHGAFPSQAMRTITIPLMRKALIAGWILVFVQIAREISLTVLLFTSNTRTAAVEIWFANFGGTVTTAYTLATVLAVLIFVAVTVGGRLTGGLVTQRPRFAKQQRH